MIFNKKLVSISKIDNTEANKKQLQFYFSLLDQSFTPQFSDLIDDVNGYISKLISYAYIYQIKHKNDFAGLSAFYVNKSYAFITFIAVLPLYKGNGIAQFLLDNIFQITLQNNVTEVHLEVRCDNDRALQFYRKNNFDVDLLRSKKDLFFYMVKKL